METTAVRGTPENGFRKAAPKQPAAPAPSVRELVTKHGDLWAVMSRNWSHVLCVFPDRGGHDQHDAAIMRMCERGDLPRVDVQGL